MIHRLQHDLRHTYVGKPCSGHICIRLLYELRSRNPFRRQRLSPCAGRQVCLLSSQGGNIVRRFRALPVMCMPVRRVGDDSRTDRAQGSRPG